jgi:hypothetical protein
VEGGAGALVAGRVGDRDLDPGFIATASGSYLALPETSARPFLLFSLSASVLVAPDFTAGDLRIGAVAGKTFLGRLTPYLAARAFGGPVSVRSPAGDRTGGDTHHYALGGGATLRLGNVDVFIDGAALGERSLSAGAGLSF